MANKKDNAQGYKETEELLAATGKGIGELFGGWGYALIVFPFGQGTDDYVSNYISNGKREDMIIALRKTADRLEKNEVIPIAEGTC